jgi:hypothetical protein
MPLRRTFIALAVVVGCSPLTTGSFGGDDGPIERRFEEEVQPFLRSYCLACHGEKKQEAKLDLSGFSSLAVVVKNHRTWDLILERLEADEMPPGKATRHPKSEERKTVVAWIRALLADQARKNAGDPGPVLARRLSNAEYDYTIRDLTGVDLRPTREFPVDPANEAGFDNSGESLAMSPALLRKYLDAARRVSDHVVLKPGGFEFAPEPAVTDTDRDKYCVKRIIDFYQRHPVDYADYFLAAWKYQHRIALRKANATLAEIAKESGLSAKYLETIWSILTESDNAVGPLAELRLMWQRLPTDPTKVDDAKRQCEQVRDTVLRWRRVFEPNVGKLSVRGISAGSQTLVLWRNRRLAERHMTYPGGGVVLKPEQGEAKTVETPRVTLAANDPAIPRAEAEFARFCRVFPAAFVVSDRGPYFDPKAAGKGRPLTAGFHLMQGYFRDDAPLYELVLDEAAQRELDTLWLELNFVTLVPLRQYKDFVFFERAEPPRFMQEAKFDFARSEDKDACSEAKIKQLAEAYLTKARKNGASDEAIKAIETYFQGISADIRQVEQGRRDAEPNHLRALENFLERAYRRPVARAEKDEFLAFYRELREKDELSHELAIRDCIASVLISPYFCYRFDVAEAGEASRPLSDYALASRLSYFVWSSMPDEELLSHAAAGDLHTPDVLVAQARRMLRDERVRGLASEFAGHWLDFRRFEEHNSVDRERFTSFTNELRQAMYEEPIHFFIDVASHDRSVLDFLYADHTFVNRLLANHYGIPMPKAGPNEWVRVDRAGRYGRGGLMPMSAFLTANSPGLRTSPVKRGYWVVRRLLGEHIPSPPPTVPELPKDEAKTGDLTLPQLLAKHRENKSCAACHQRFDAIGLVFEGYGPIGERRDRDFGGRPVDPKATFPDGTEGDGLEGLRHYLSQKRQADFLDNLCRKLLAYALGRGLLPSDDAMLKMMRERLVSNGYRFDTLIESIVTSPQFLNRRGRDDPRE